MSVHCELQNEEHDWLFVLIMFGGLLFVLIMFEGLVFVLIMFEGLVFVLIMFEGLSKTVEGIWRRQDQKEKILTKCASSLASLIAMCKFFL